MHVYKFIDDPTSKLDESFQIHRFKTQNKKYNITICILDDNVPILDKTEIERKRDGNRANL